MEIAKVFMTGRSQAVRLPKAFRFDTSEVSIEKLADGAVLLRAKPQGLLGDRLLAVLKGLPDDPTFERPEQGLPQERDWLDAPVAAVRKPAARKAANRQAAVKKPPSTKLKR
jgi:antitoxin VapB